MGTVNPKWVELIQMKALSVEGLGHMPRNLTAHAVKQKFPNATPNPVGSAKQVPTLPTSPNPKLGTQKTHKQLMGISLP